MSQGSPPRDSEETRSSKEERHQGVRRAVSPPGPPAEASVTLSGLVVCDVCDDLHEPPGPLLIQSMRSSSVTGMGCSPRSI